MPLQFVNAIFFFEISTQASICVSLFASIQTYKDTMCYIAGGEISQCFLEKEKWAHAERKAAWERIASTRRKGMTASEHKQTQMSITCVKINHMILLV